jgi:cytochrome d ubiquinol oxidase subunit II
VTLGEVLAGVLLVALNFYVVLAGADFGGGVWDMLASGPRKTKQRELIAQAIGPVWEANHVWLILAVVLLFSCFPAAFARIAIALHVPLSLVLVGIVLRGSAFSFRSYGGASDEIQRRWGRVFASASLLTPLLLGTGLGAIAAGAVPDPHTVMGGAFYERFVAPWLTPFALSVGIFTVVMFAFLAAVYLTLETSDPELRGDFRARAICAGIGLFFAAVLALVLSRLEAPLVWRGLVGAPWSLPLHVLTAAAAVTTFAALLGRRWRMARVAAIAQASLIVWGWALGQYPLLVPPDLTIVQAAGPEATLKLVMITLIIGAALLFPSLYYLLRVFKRPDETTVAAPQSPPSREHGAD